MAEQAGKAETTKGGIAVKSGEAERSPARRGLSPMSMWRQLSDDMDRFFSGGWLGRFGPFDLERGAISPKVEVFEREGKLVVRADLPGVSKDDIRAEIQDDQIVISGERRSESEREERGMLRSEVSYGSFWRAIPLPSGASADAAEASFKDGVLEVSVPLGQRSTGKKIEVRGAEAQTRH